MSGWQPGEQDSGPTGPWVIRWQAFVDAPFQLTYATLSSLLPGQVGFSGAEVSLMQFAPEVIGVLLLGDVANHHRWDTVMVEKQRLCFMCLTLTPQRVSTSPAKGCGKIWVALLPCLDVVPANMVSVKVVWGSRL